MKPPELTPMTSSVFSGHHYDPATNRLTVRFNNGKTWIYDDVPHEKAVTFAGALSPGRYFSDKIKGLYHGREIG